MGKIINKHPINYHKLKFDYKWQMERFSLLENEAKDKIIKMKKDLGNSYIFSVKWSMIKYNITELEAKEKIEKLKNKIKYNIRDRSDFEFKAMSPKNKEHWIKKGMPESEAIKKSKNQVKHMQKCCQVLRKENPEKYLNTYNTKIEYWLKKTKGDKELALKLYKERQATNTLKKFIERHGDSGYDKWKKRNIEWSKLMEEKYAAGEYSKEPLNPILSGAISGIENKFIDELSELIPNKIQRQFKIAKQTSGYYFYDVLIDKKVIIEFNGNFWHANPTIYESDWINVISHQTARDIWKRDKLKKELAKSLGYIFLVVWEKDYVENTTKCLNELVREIKNYD